ncbi:uncharacterized protein LOC135838379 [Planococcus citri]|uniref:uncharacterized protein LOC135838379 n=1 Tax=Planococcus citri TaxID=170843 RepID=UPI0031F898C8
MIGINDSILQYFLICLFLIFLNPNCRVLCGEAKELRKHKVKFCDVPTTLPHTNITYQCTKYIKNQSKSCVYNETVFESTAIKISCDDGYSTDATVSVCNGNEWVPPITGCRKMCKKLNPVNVHLECFRENVSIPCDEKYLVSGVTVRPTCDHLNSSGFVFYPGHQEIHCQEDGNWDNDLLSCVRGCGRLQKNSSDSETRGMPWDVTIFPFKGKNACLGTIISPRVILTTEYCVRNMISGYEDYNSMSRPSDPDNFMVGVFRDAPHYEKNSSWWDRLKYYAYKLDPLKELSRYTFLEIKEFRYFKHGNQDKSFFHDASIVILEEEISFNSHVHPACVQWETPKRLNITTGIAKVHHSTNEKGHGFEDHSFWSHDACQKNPNYPHIVYNFVCDLYTFYKANRVLNDTKLSRVSNQTALHEGKLFCIEQKQDELNVVVHGSGVMIKNDDRYFIRGIAGEVLHIDQSNSDALDANFKHFMNEIRYIANISYDDLSKNISDAISNGSPDTGFVDKSVFLFNNNFPSLLQNHLKSAGTELTYRKEKLVSVTDVADYVDWIKHVVAEVDPYYNPST